ncbi:hypothetical protein SDC9_107325 [bioreactor metagenome]|uniref:Uncharacterized protein n=1 Tax=bioreactor metagenome TaxID=1076179 RepID=A0A645BFI0_9ZZZZ
MNARREGRESQEFHPGARKQLPAVGEPGHVVPGQTAAAVECVVLGEQRYRLEEFTDRLCGNAVVLDQPVSRLVQVLFDLCIASPLGIFQRHGREGHPERRDELVAGRPRVVQIEADVTEIAPQNAIAVIIAGDSRRESEPPRVLGTQREGECLRAVAVAFIGDQEPFFAPHERGLAVRRLHCHDEHLPGQRTPDVIADARTGQQIPQGGQPLLHQNKAGDDHHRAHAVVQRLGDRRCTDSGLSRSGHGLHHA